MKKVFSLSALFAFLLLTAVPQARAQAQIELGPRVGFEVDEIEAFALGADVRVSSIALPVQVNGTFDYYFTDDDDFAGTDPTVFRFTANGLYEISFDNEVFVPYIGAGLSVTHVSLDLPDEVDVDDSESDVGLNIVGGAEFEVADFGAGSVRPFAQAEFVPVGGDIQPFQITGGILFQIGGM